MQTVRSCGANVVSTATFADHHLFSSHDIASLESQASQSETPCDLIVCTGKDLAKIDAIRLGRYDLWSLDIEMQVRTGEAILGEYLQRMLASIPPEPSIA